MLTIEKLNSSLEYGARASGLPRIQCHVAWPVFKTGTSAVTFWGQFVLT